ncbi:DUF3558 family protein [Nocardia sp. NPDC058058]|uniref:DUF3558 family protein n=1 Tax=Nocardia sp. NPDC058058 TaxID=3346317 RepID=UPI0036DCB369
MRVNRIAIGAVLLVTGMLTGCSASTPPAPVAAPAEDNTLAGCGPLPTATIERTVAAIGLRQQLSPTICSWTGTSATGGPIGLTYGWLKKNSLMFDRQTATDLGYSTENAVVKSFGGFYWHDPRDPGACGLSAADSGTVTWWVHNRDHSAQPDPCAAALQLMLNTVQLDG